MPESTDSTAAQQDIPDPLPDYRVKLVIDEKTEGHFTEVSGLGGEGAPAVRAIPGRISYGAVTLRFGLTASRELMAWLMASTEGTVSRRNVSIVILDPSGNGGRVAAGMVRRTVERNRPPRRHAE